MASLAQLRQQLEEILHLAALEKLWRRQSVLREPAVGAAVQVDGEVGGGLHLGEHLSMGKGGGKEEVTSKE